MCKHVNVFTKTHRSSSKPLSLNYPHGASKPSHPPLVSLLLCLIFLGVVPVSQVLGYYLMLENFFVLNLWLRTSPFASFSLALDTTLQSSTDPAVCLHRTDFSVLNPQIPPPSCWMALPYLDLQQMQILIPIHSRKLWGLTEYQRERGLPRTSHPGFIK